MKKTIVLSLIVLFSFLLSSCDDNAKTRSFFQENYTISHRQVHHIRVGTIYNYDPMRASQTVVDSLADLHGFFETHQGVIDFDTSYGGDNPSFSVLAEQYDEGFFETNGVIILIIDEGSGSIRHHVKGLEVNEDMLMILLEREVPETGTDDMATWLIVIEYEKASLAFEDTEIIWQD